VIGDDHVADFSNTVSGSKQQ